MKYINRYDRINPYAVTRVRYHARQLIKHSSINGMEVEDIEQELMLHYILHIKSYDQQRSGLNTFIDNILRHKCADLVREAKAQKRNLSTHSISLDAWLADHEEEEGMQCVTICDGTNTMDVAVNMGQILRKLPTRLANLLKDLETSSIGELSKNHYMPRWKIYRSIRDIHKRLYGHKIPAKIICNKVSTFSVYR